jgi:hypothetical protein
MSGPFCSPYCLDDRLFEPAVLLSWRGGAPPKVDIPLSASTSPGARLVEVVPMFFDTGATFTSLTLFLARHLGLDLTWNNKDELSAARIADGRYYISIKRRITIRVGGTWYPVQACVPINYSAGAVTARRLEEARDVLGLNVSVADVVPAITSEILGVRDVMRLFLACVTDEGLYLFPKKRHRD